ncbi:MAG: DUF6391 domain-containing protein [Cyanobacteriota bacterium]
MTDSASANTGNPWNFDFFTPHPTQDSDLLKQMNFVPGLKQLLLLRQTHALEHGTVWVLSEMANRLGKPRQFDNETLGGLSTDQGFYLYGEVNPLHLQRAVSSALQRFREGEWDLAVHPRCGTNLSVAMMLTTGFAIGTHLLLPRGPIEQMLGLAFATTTAAQIAPDFGNLVQKYMTTAIPFNLEVAEIRQTADIWGRSAHFVGVRWRDSQ